MQQRFAAAWALGIRVLAQVLVAQPPCHLVPPALPRLLDERKTKPNVLILLPIPFSISTDERRLALRGSVIVTGACGADERGRGSRQSADAAEKQLHATHERAD